jgi:hypothetical protein
MGIGFRIGQVVDRYHLELICAAGFIDSAHDIPANATITVNCYFYCHFFAPD